MVTIDMKHAQELFAQQYSTYIDEIYRYVFFSVGQQTQLAEDITSTVFFNTWKSIERYDATKASFRTYLYRIAKNTVIDYYRTRKETVELDENCAPTFHDKCAEKVDAKLFWSDAQYLLEADAYEIMVLKYRNELTIQEIAEIYDSTIDSVKSLLKRSRSLMKDAYETR